VTPELAKEIQQVLMAPVDSQAAWNLPITDLLPGEELPAWHAYSYVVPRLYNRLHAPDVAPPVPGSHRDQIRRCFDPTFETVAPLVRFVVGTDQ